MEQNNLVVTADGKTWDEVTRNTSYIGNLMVSCTTNTNYAGGGNDGPIIFDDFRGSTNYPNQYFNKDFAIAYGRIICLVEGQYTINARTIRRGAWDHCRIKINGTDVMSAHSGTSNHDTPQTVLKLNLKRGDSIEIFGSWYSHQYYSDFKITRNT